MSIETVEILIELSYPAGITTSRETSWTMTCMYPFSVNLQALWTSLPSALQHDISFHSFLCEIQSKKCLPHERARIIRH